MKKMIAMIVAATFGLTSIASFAAPQPTPQPAPNQPAPAVKAPAHQYAKKKVKAPKKAKKLHRTHRAAQPAPAPQP